MKITRKYVVIGFIFICFYAFLTGNANSQNFSKDASPIKEAPKKTETALNPKLNESDVNKMLMDEGIAPEPGAATEEQAASQYTLGATDVIEITVLRHPEVSGKYSINDEGNIQYEFVGDITLAGLKKDQATELIKKKLSTYIFSPEISLKIAEYNSKVVYVIGEVGLPGKVFMRGDSITVREALIRAGLPLLSAKASNSKLITPSLKNQPVIKHVDVNKLLYEGDLKENLVMKPGDTLYIPSTVMTKIMRVIQPVTNPVITAAGAGRSVMSPF
ncbi:MAG: polysaccharide export protein [Candidatus Omnitrophica bacterium]|nr:polysaccharide export protein [Candidatus Omnitrophota bacterium]